MNIILTSVKVVCSIIFLTSAIYLCISFTRAAYFTVFFNCEEYFKIFFIAYGCSAPFVIVYAWLQKGSHIYLSDKLNLSAIILGIFVVCIMRIRSWKELLLFHEVDDKLEEEIEVYEQENEDILSFMKEIIKNCTGKMPEEDDILALIHTIPEEQSNVFEINEKYNDYMEHQNKIKELEEKQKELYMDRFNVDIFE